MFNSSSGVTPVIAAKRKLVEEFLREKSATTVDTAIAPEALPEGCESGLNSLKYTGHVVEAVDGKIYLQNKA